MTKTMMIRTISLFKATILLMEHYGRAMNMKSFSPP